MAIDNGRGEWESGAFGGRGEDGGFI